MKALISCASGGWKLTTTFIDRLVSNELIIGISLKKFITKSLAIFDEDRITSVPSIMSVDTDGLPLLFEIFQDSRKPGFVFNLGLDSLCTSGLCNFLELSCNDCYQFLLHHSL